MARYEQPYSGERRTAALHVQLSPSERAELEGGAAAAGAASLSAYVRVLLFRRLAEAMLVAQVRRNPDARELARQLSAIGNNLNQLARVANATGDLAVEAELRAAIGLVKVALSRALAL